MDPEENLHKGGSCKHILLQGNSNLKFVWSSWEPYQYVPQVRRVKSVGSNTKTGDELVLSSQMFSFSNPDHIRYFS